MQEAHNLRLRTYDERINWQSSDCLGGESDTYNAEAVYFIAVEGDGAVVGSWRMMPTSKYFMAQDIFPQLFDSTGSISSDLVWELSQCAVDASYYGRNSQGLKSMIAGLTCAVLEFAIMNGITEYLSIQNRIITRFANRFGGKPVWKSHSIETGKSEASCYSYEPSMERLYALRTQFGLPAPVMSQYQMMTDTVVH